jgi:exopolysaccharide production protein ExoQ
VRPQAVVARPVRVVQLNRAIAASLRSAERFLAFFALSTFCGTPLLLLQIAGVASGSSTTRIVKVVTLVPIYAIATAMLLTSPSRLMRAARKNWPIIMLLLLMFTSALWSEDPGLTVRRVVTLASTFVVGLYLATRFAVREVLDLAALALIAVAVSSAVVAVLLPEHGIGAGVFAGEWRGIYPHKQMLGMHMALGVLLCTVLALDSPGRRRVMFWPGAILCGVLTVLSGSATAVFVMLVSLSALPLLRLLQRRGLVGLTVVTFVVSFGICVALVVFDQSEVILAQLGKESTLTGRLPLWNYVVERIAERPLLGYGYNGFWLGTTGPSESVLLVTGGWYPWHAHNGWLQLCLDVGLVGLVVFLAGYARAVSQTLGIHSASWTDAVWPIGYLLFLLVLSAAETVLLRPNTVFTALFTIVVFGHGTATSRAGSSAAPSARAGRARAGWNGRQAADRGGVAGRASVGGT